MKGWKDCPACAGSGIVKVSARKKIECNVLEFKRVRMYVEELEPETCPECRFVMGHCDPECTANVFGVRDRRSQE